MAEIQYTVDLAIKRFTEPNWCWNDHICDCDGCRAGRVLAEEVKRLRAEQQVSDHDKA